MANNIHLALTNAAVFRAEQGDSPRAVQLLTKSIEIADHGGSLEERFFARIEMAHFYLDNGQPTESEAMLRDAIEIVPMSDFNLRHALAIKELGELVETLGRTEEGIALQLLAERVFDTLADDVCIEALERHTRQAC